MNFRFGRDGKRSPARAKASKLVDPKGRRLLGLTYETREPIWSPSGHSLMLASSGAGKTTRGLMPWIFSLIASGKDRPAMLVLDSKDGEVAAQCVPMLDEMGIPWVLIDDMGMLPGLKPTALNPLQSAVSTYRDAPQDLIFASDAITQSLIPEPPEGDQKNFYWRSFPRLLLEFALLVLLKRNPDLATPGGIWSLITSPSKLGRFAEIEANEGSGLIKSYGETICQMIGHEHWPQHVEAASTALRVFTAGMRLHLAGHGATTSHAELIKQRAVIFLCGSQAQMDSLGGYYGLHLMSFIRAAYGRAGPLWIGADEFTNAPVKKLVSALTTLRSFGVTVSMIAQSRSEIERKLGRLELQTIEDNSPIKQFLGFNSFSEAERVSKAIGEQHAVATALSGNLDDLKLNSNLSLIKQNWMTPAELMALPPELQIIHIKGLGFYLAHTISQANIAPYCDFIADNPIEGGRLPSDPWITLPLPKGEGA